MDFSEALLVLKRGGRVARAGWNGRGMHLELVQPYTRPSDPTRGNKYFVKLDVTDRVPHPEHPPYTEISIGDMLYGERIARTEEGIVEEPRATKLLPWIGMKTADNCFVPWLASQTDMLAEDYELVP